MRTSRLALAAALAAGLAFVSCFEPPVKEALHLRFLSHGAVVVTSTVLLAGPELQSNPALERRLAETRRDLLEGRDPWGTRFAALEPAAERSSWEKRLGELHKASRDAVLAEPESLARFFGDTSLAVTYEVSAERGVAELTVVPGPSGRATQKQRKEMDRTLDEWTANVAEYLAAGEALYAYLDDRPERARPCLGALFDDLLAEGERAALGEPTAEEKKLLESLGEAMAKVWDVLLIPGGGEYSADEVSHLVYDPFPARLSVSLPGRPLEVEGFAVGERGVLEVPGFGLWDALKSLEGRWLSPDPIVIYVSRGGRSQERPLDLDSLLGEPRRAAPAPSVDEVRGAVESLLTPAPLYRAVWKVEPEDETPFTWEED